MTTKEFEQHVIGLQNRAYLLHLEADRFYHSDILATAEYVSRYNELARAAAKAETEFRTAEQQLFNHWEDETSRRYEQMTEEIL